MSAPAIAQLTPSSVVDLVTGGTEAFFSSIIPGSDPTTTLLFATTTPAFPTTTTGPIIGLQATSTAAVSSSGGSKSNTTALIVGLVCGILLLVGILAFIFSRWRIRSAKKTATFSRVSREVPRGPMRDMKTQGDAVSISETLVGTDAAIDPEKAFFPK